MNQTCSRCQTSKPVEEFYRRSNGTLERACKICERQRVLAHKQAQREALGSDEYRQAEADRQRLRRMNGGGDYDRAYKRALRRLRDNHRPEFEALLGALGTARGEGHWRASGRLAQLHKIEFEELLAQERGLVR